MPRNCPVEPGNYSALNVTFVDETTTDDEGLAIIATVMRGPIPNGVFRHVFKAHTKRDPDAGTAWFEFEMHDKMGENF